jgi:hypothetical protein
MLTWAYETYTLSAWRKDNKEINTYNATNLPLSYTAQVGNGSVWVNDSRETYTYDMSNNPALFTIETWTNNTWTNDMQATFTVVANNVTAIVLEMWVGNAWVKFLKANFTYNAANKPLIETYQNWTGTAWLNDNRNVYTYDVNNNETSETNQDWLSNSWKTTNYHGRRWDSNSFNYSDVQRFYSGGGPVIYGDSSVTYYKTVVGIKENRTHEDLLTVYPNPGKGVFTIGNAKDITLLKVYNIQGTEVFKTKVESENTSIDLSHLPAGMYFIRVNRGNTPIIHKVIIE